MQFRTWATKVLDTFTKQGYVLDKSRLINGQIFDEDYFEHLIAEIQEIRASERRFYQKITDIYATAVDYDKNSQVTREFYATVQNKMHYAVHGNTAAEVIVARADHNKEALKRSLREPTQYESALKAAQANQDSKKQGKRKKG